MTASPSTRRLNGVTVPEAGVWTLDPGHAEIAFIGRHFMLTKVRGRFLDVAATVAIGRRPEDTSIEATIGMASVFSGDDARDDHLRSPDFFDVGRFPSASFRSTHIEWSGRTGKVTGDLTIRDVTHPVTLDVEYVGAVRDTWGSDRAAFAATATIDRENWGLTWNMLLETGGLVVSKEIALELHVELIRNM